MSAREIVDELELASHDLDDLIRDMRNRRPAARNIEDMDERVQAIAARMLVAVRGNGAVGSMLHAKSR